MEVETAFNHGYGEPSWANDAYFSMSDANDRSASDKWPNYSNTPTFSPSAMTIPPALLSTSSVERFGQITPPEEHSPAHLQSNKAQREGSISLEDIQNEALFPDHQVQALQNYQSPKDQVAEPSAKRRRTSRQPSTKASAPSQPEGQTHTQTQAQAQSLPAPQEGQPPKRKRGRPKSTPQMVEHYTADGFPFQVSSARQSHLEKNRVAAHKCRLRKKDYINSLEGRAREFSAKNKALKENVAMLREEVLELKNEVLRHAGCGFWAVDEYLARCAGDLLGMEPPGATPNTHNTRPNLSPVMTSPSLDSDQMRRNTSTESPDMQGSPVESLEDDDYSGFEYLENMDEDGDMNSA